MSNTAFQKTVVATPVAPNKGGTGTNTLYDKSVLIGAGTASVAFVAPGSANNILVSDGTNWVSGTATMGSGTVSYAKLASDLVGIVAMGANDVDWSAGALFTKTLSGNTVLTFSNYQLDKNIVLKIDGNYTLTLPASVIIMGGAYDGTAMNYISLHCTNATGGSEQVWAMINQSSA
jgi:hypothetical protein